MHLQQTTRILVLILVGLLVTLETRRVEAQQDAPKQTYAWEKDVLYRSGDDLTDYMKRQCRLDVYYPEGVEDYTTVLWFHAGGLKRGSRYVPGELRNKGMAVVSVSYRLNPNVQAPAYIEDAAAAVAWVFNNIERFGGSPDRIVVAGASAGAYLTMMVGLDKSWLEVYGIDANRLAGLVAVSGQVITHVAVREEQGGNRTKPVVDRYAPLYHVRKDAPPLLMTTGDRELELLGRYEENAYFERMMKIVGHTKTELYELEGFNHAGIERASYPLVVKFLERISKGE